MGKLRKGPVSSIIKEVCKSKEKNLTREIIYIMSLYGEDCISSVVELACEYAECDGKKRVHKEQIFKAMEKLGINYMKYQNLEG